MPSPGHRHHRRTGGEGGLAHPRASPRCRSEHDRTANTEYCAAATKAGTLVGLDGRHRNRRETDGGGGQHVAGNATAAHAEDDDVVDAAGLRERPTARPAPSAVSICSGSPAVIPHMSSESTASGDAAPPTGLTPGRLRRAIGPLLSAGLRPGPVTRRCGSALKRALCVV